MAGWLLAFLTVSWALEAACDYFAGLLALSVNH